MADPSGSDAGIVCDRFIDWSVKNWRRQRGRVTLRIRMADESPHCDDATPAGAAKARLYAGLTGLGPRALAILADIAERLQRGARQYGGDFDDKPRDWRREANEEALDYMVYMTMAYMEERERRAADEARQKAAVRLHDQTLASLAGTPTLSRPPRRQTDPTKPVIESFHTPVSACGCYVCAPEAREAARRVSDETQAQLDAAVKRVSNSRELPCRRPGCVSGTPVLNPLTRRQVCTPCYQDGWRWHGLTREYLRSAPDGSGCG